MAALAVASCAVGGCSDEDQRAREQPTELSLVESDSGCVELTSGADVEASWCATNITSFDVELAYENPEDHYGLLTVVSGHVLPSPDYVVWEEKGKFVLVASSDASRPLQELTFLVEREGVTLRCSGESQMLQCAPQSA